MRKYSSSSACGAKVNRKGEAGFTMIEMVVAMVILFVGLIAAAQAISYALAVTNKGRGVTNSKLLVISVLEQMETLRNTKQLTFAQIANTADVDNKGANYVFTGFPSSPQYVSRNPGPDGIFGTIDDLTSPGPDGKYRTADDVPNDMSQAMSGYSRTIKIELLSSDIKKITVTLDYPGPTGEKLKMTASSYLNNDPQANYLP
jgi:prepilin-type N-terminal cleavage/methylation domain-containing protein